MTITIYPAKRILTLALCRRLLVDTWEKLGSYKIWDRTPHGPGSLSRLAGIAQFQLLESDSRGPILHGVFVSVDTLRRLLLDLELPFGVVPHLDIAGDTSPISSNHRVSATLNSQAFKGSLPAIKITIPRKTELPILRLDVNDGRRLAFFSISIFLLCIGSALLIRLRWGSMWLQRSSPMLLANRPQIIKTSTDFNQMYGMDATSPASAGLSEQQRISLRQQMSR